MVPHSRRALLRRCGGLVCAATAGCLQIGGPSFEENCEDDSLTTGEGSASGAARWPEYAADPGNTGARATTGPDEGVLAWRYATCDPMGETSPVVADGMVYVALNSDPGTRAFDATTGEQQWSATFTGTAAGHALHDGTLLVAGHGIQAFDAADGTVEWTFTRPDTATPEGNDQPQSPGPIWSAPTVADGTVYVGGGLAVPWLYALNAADGSVRWRIRLPGSNLTSSPAVGSGSIYVVDDTNRLVAVNRDDGRIEWTLDEFEQLDDTPVVADGRVFVVAGSTVHGVTTAGERAWATTVEDAASPVAVAGGRVYVPSDTAVTALDAATGDETWTHEAGTGAPFGPPVVADGTVYAGRAGERVEVTDRYEPQGSLVALDAATGEEAWTYTTRGIPAGEGGPYAGTRESLAVADGTLFACTDAGDLYALAGR